MSEEQSVEIYPVEQKVVLFYEDELIAVQGQDHNIYVAIAHICDTLGIDRRAQIQRIQRTNALLRGYRLGSINTGSGRRSTALLRTDLLPLWLAGISTKSIREEMRPKIERLQDEAAKILWEAFQDGRLTTIDTDFDQLLAQNTPAAQAYKMAQAMMQLARNQLVLEARLEETRAQIQDHGDRIERLEETVGDPGRQISPEQAMQISQSVKGIAMALSKKTGRNEYGGVYGEFYRKFGINSYKILPMSQFDAAMRFLNDWYQDLVGDAPF